MRRHLDTLGWAFTLYGLMIVSIAGLLCIPGLVLTFVATAPWELGPLIGVAVALLVVLAAPFLAAGRGIARQPWARPLAGDVRAEF